MAQAVTASAGSLATLSTSVATKASLKASSSVNVSGAWKSQPKRNLAVRAAGGDESETRTITGVVFEPFVEVESQLVQVPTEYSESLARQRYATSSEAAINDQIKYVIALCYDILFSLSGALTWSRSCSQPVPFWGLSRRSTIAIICLRIGLGPCSL
jgi:ferritin heavy chain